MKLNDGKLNKISDIGIDTGIVVLASNIVPLLNQEQKTDINSIIPSLLLTIGLWIFSIIILKGEK